MNCNVISEQVAQTLSTSSPMGMHGFGATLPDFLAFDYPCRAHQPIEHQVFLIIQQTLVIEKTTQGTSRFNESSIRVRDVHRLERNSPNKACRLSRW